MIGYDAAIIRRAIIDDAAQRVTDRLRLESFLTQVTAARRVDLIELEVVAAGYTPADARRIVDDALELENRRLANRRRPTSSSPAPRRGPSILRVVR